jgi:hypothetical protein
MQAGITATGRQIFFSTESNPPIDVVSERPDLYGNTHRVGHDIMADWHSILSMVDIAANLHQFAHNDSGLGGFFNDMDMIEIGNPGDFHSDLDMIRTHFTYWVIMKSNLLLSTLLDELSPDILAIVTSKDALAIHRETCFCVLIILSHHDHQLRRNHYSVTCSSIEQSNICSFPWKA